MIEISLSKTVAFLVFLACTGHATLGVISGETSLRGGAEISLKSDPLSFIIIIAIEIVASLYIFWAFFIDKEKDNDAEENNYPTE